MKKLLILLLIFGGIALLVYSTVAAAPEAPDQFIIEYADGTRYVDMADSTELSGLIGNVAPRFVIEYANLNRYVDMMPVPAEMQTLLGVVAPRFVIEYANANRFVELSYPIALIGDTTAPTLLTQEPTVYSGATLSIKWTTSEYTTGLVEYGLKSNTYTGSVADDYFRILHTTVITGVTPDTTVYYRITMNDRSGNETVSPEYSVEIKTVEFTFLPVVTR